MIESREKEIAGDTYKVTMLGAVTGRKVFRRLMTYAAKGDMGSMLGAMTDDDMTFFCDTFAEKTFLLWGDKQPLLSKVFDLHFAGKYEIMVQWLLFCIEVNFSAFFQGPTANPPADASKD